MEIENREENITGETFEEDDEPKQTAVKKIRKRPPLKKKFSDAKSTMSKHGGIKYPCNKCDYQATQQISLQRHIESIHEGIKYPCNQCDYQATEKGSLQRHVATMHSNKILKCELCDYQTKWKPEYNRHKKTHTMVQIIQI